MLQVIIYRDGDYVYLRGNFAWAWVLIVIYLSRRGGKAMMNADRVKWYFRFGKLRESNEIEYLIDATPTKEDLKFCKFKHSKELWGETRVTRLQTNIQWEEGVCTTPLQLSSDEHHTEKGKLRLANAKWRNYRLSYLLTKLPEGLAEVSVADEGSDSVDCAPTLAGWGIGWGARIDCSFCLVSKPVGWALPSRQWLIASVSRSERNFWPARPTSRARRASPSPASSRTPADSKSNVDTRSGIFRFRT